MNYEFINAVGLPCPLPVVQAKKALAQSDVDCVGVKVDNFAAVQNLEKMAAGLGFGFEHNKVSDSEFDVVLAKRGSGSVSRWGEDAGGEGSGLSSEDMKHGSELDLPEPDAVSRSGHFVVAIGSDAMGRGSDELGKVLMKSFIYSLTELDSHPQAVLFFNSGAFLTNSKSSTTQDLQSLADAGTKVLTCGACIDYYKLPSPAVGEITNMFEIAEIMSKAQRLISL